MNRRQFLWDTIPLFGATGFPRVLAAPRDVCSPLNVAGKPGTIPRRIDSHCHVFNGSDLQIADFVSKVVSHEWSIPKDLAEILAELLSALATLAPLACDEKRWLDESFDHDRALGRVTASTRRKVADRMRKDDESTLSHARDLLNKRAELRERIARYLERSSNVASRPSARRRATALEVLRRGGISSRDTAEIFRLPGLGEIYEFLKPMLRHRIANCKVLLDEYTCAATAIDTYFCALLDFDLWLGSEPTPSPIPDQLAVMERISEIMGGRFRPYVPYNPWKDLLDPGYFPLLASYVQRRPFVGFKIYPPMGFAPYGNEAIPSAQQPAIWQAAGIVDFPRKLDETMIKFLAWCAKKDVPIMAHANPSNGPDEHSVVLGSPSHWRAAFHQLEQLHMEIPRLSAGHFGGDKVAANDDWSLDWAGLMGDYPGVFADLSYWGALLLPPSDPKRRAAIEKLSSIVHRFPGISDRLMYGTDWNLLAIEPGWPQYAHDFIVALGPVFANKMDAVLGGNAIAFAGASRI